MKKQPTEVGGIDVRPRARSNDLVVRELPEEELVYDLRNHQAYCLNKTAAAVWRHCDGQKTIEDIAALLAQETKTPMDEAMVKIALHQLGKANLMEQGASFSAEKPQQSRREILRRLGLGAAAALPLITSIIAPSAVQAQSCGDPNNNSKQNAVGCPCQSLNDCTNDCCGFGFICADLGSVPTGNSCRVNCECMTTCCGLGDVCAVKDSVPANGSCRADCECVGSLKCLSQICQ